LREDWDLSSFLNEKTWFYQKKGGFRFGTDTFLLTDFVRLKGSEYIADLGTGCGVIPILLLKKYKDVRALAIDVLAENVELTRENARLNGVEERLKVKLLNVKDIKKEVKGGVFDVVVSNPPFIEDGAGNVASNYHRAVARQELEARLEDFVSAAAYLLKNRGSFYVLLPVQRFVDVLCLMRKYRLEPKRVRFIQPDYESDANLFLMEGRKNSGKGLVVEPPLVVYCDSKKRIYTKEVEEKYGGFFER